MKKLNKAVAILLGLCLIVGMFVFAGCGETEKKVKSVKVSTVPAKIEYHVGDTVDFSDGVITVTYDDDSTETKKFTDEGVEVSEVTTEINDETLDSTEKTVTVRFGGKSDRFKVTVSHEMMLVTFDYGYTGATNGTSSVRKNYAVEKPADPTRENYIFDNWYSDAALTMTYEFDSKITENTTIYARWLEDAIYYDVSFNLNYKGAAKASEQKIKEGDKVTKPTVDPTRYGYEFLGWYTTSACTTEFDFKTTTIEAKTTIYAKWNRTLDDTAREYVFEAEDTDLAGKTGPGLSGSAPGTAMIQTADDLGASGNRFIGYQYSEVCSIEFQIVSDKEVHDAKIVLRLSAEMRDYNMNPDNYTINLNGEPVTYSEIQFVNVPVSGSDDTERVRALQFKDFVILENATLVEGLNTIQLQTSNDHLLDGTTVLSDAPLIDCLKITTSAALDWSAALGLPKKNY